MTQTIINGAADELDADESSIAQIYDQHVDFVWRTVRRLGVGLESIDDAVQDVFLVVHRRLHDFEHRSTLKTWMYGIALRVAGKYRRRNARDSRLEELPQSTVDLHALNPHDEACKAEAVQILDALLGQLDDDKREVFVLAELEGMNVPEIAGVLEINLNTAYARLRAARKGFNKAVGRYQASRRGRPS